MLQTTENREKYKKTGGGSTNLKDTLMHTAGPRCCLALCSFWSVCFGPSHVSPHGMFVKQAAKLVTPLHLSPSP